MRPNSRCAVVLGEIPWNGLKKKLMGDDEGRFDHGINAVHIALEARKSA